MTSPAPIQVCPLCTSAEPEHVTALPLGAGLWKYTCTNVGRYHAEKYEWESVGNKPIVTGGYPGVMEELGIYDVLLTVLGRLGRFAEHGVVEYEFALEAPEVYAELVRRYSHTELGTTSFTASALLGSALGRLWSRDQVAYKPVDATGRWKYNGRTSAWCLPSDGSATSLSWSEYAFEHRLDPDLWPLDELLHGQHPNGAMGGTENSDRVEAP